MPNRGANKAQKNFWKSAFVHILFPQLIAGPIVKYHDVEQEIEYRTQSADGVARGIRRFIAGLSKKVLISNVMGMTADALFGAAVGTLGAATAWVGHFSYLFQIYFDFSGLQRYGDRTWMDVRISFQGEFQLSLQFDQHPGILEKMAYFPVQLVPEYLYIPLLAATEKAKCVPASINLSYFYVPVSGMEPT